MRVYSAAEVHARLPWPALAAVLAQVYRADRADWADRADGADRADRADRAEVQVPLRHSHALSPTDTLLLMPAWNDCVIVTKLVTVMPAAPHTVQATLLVLDRHSGRVLACMDGEAITLRRTAAVSALAAQHLARPDATRLLLVGTGRLAPWMARAHAALRPGLRHIDVWGRNGQAAHRLVALLAQEAPPFPSVQAVHDLPAAAARADIVCCATTARQPVVLGAWLRPGTHLDLVGAFRPDMREVDDAAVLRARIVVDGPAARVEAGDLVQPLHSGRLPAGQIVADLAGWLQGPRPARLPGHDLSLFKSVGSALQDLAAAQAVLAADVADASGASGAAEASDAVDASDASGH